MGKPSGACGPAGGCSCDVRGKIQHLGLNRNHVSHQGGHRKEAGLGAGATALPSPLPELLLQGTQPDPWERGEG